jgi:hypothetical protein
MAVRNENEIDMFKRSNFLLCFVINRIRKPWIDQQNFSTGRDDFKGRLTVPSELRVHTITKAKPVPGASDAKEKMTKHEDAVFRWIVILDP